MRYPKSTRKRTVNSATEEQEKWLFLSDLCTLSRKGTKNRGTCMTKTIDLPNQATGCVPITMAYPYVNVLELNLEMFFLLSELKQTCKETDAVKTSFVPWNTNLASSIFPFSKILQVIEKRSLIKNTKFCRKVPLPFV